MVPRRSMLVKANQPSPSSLTMPVHGDVESAYMSYVLICKY